jgi:uncharacterized protein
LAEIELPRAIRIVAPDGLSAVPSVLARLDRFEIDPVIRATAAANPDAGLRSLEALVTYDSRLGQAANALGITVVAPGNEP